MHAACGGEREGGIFWGLPVPRTGSPRPRQEDGVPLHPLLNSYSTKENRVSPNSLFSPLQKKVEIVSSGAL